VAFQALYRRYRPQKFGEVRGQEHATRALRNAVREGTVAHAYLFSGPRGTGKTSTARILAKALNCEAPEDGEPCGHCESCVAVEAGRSLDVIELDAASNNGVDAMRDLVQRAALGTGGRAKVYIVDEVHMLSNAASNVLLKPLEEPPAHVTWVLATTDPQKVLPTIRSRTQHFEYRLLAANTLTELLRDVSADAGLSVTEDAIALAVRRGKGSARDAESALDQLAASGGEGDEDTSLDELVESLCERDTGRALAAVAMACNAGRDPRQLGESLLSSLRDALLAVVAPDVVSLPDEALARVSDQGRRLGPPSITRALDAVGQALLDMREAPDPRVSLEVALVRVTRPELDTSPAAIVERLERLERGARTAASPATAAAAGVTGSAPGEVAADAPAPSPTTGGAAGARRALGAVRGQQAAPAAPTPAAPAPATPVAAKAPAAVPAATGPLPSRDELTTAWGDSVMRGLRGTVKAKFGTARFVSVDESGAVVAFDTKPRADLAEQVRADVEAAFAAHFGRRIPLRVTVVAPEAPVEGDEDEPPPDLHELTDAPPDNRSPIDHLTSAFPGAEVIED